MSGQSISRESNSPHEDEKKEIEREKARLYYQKNKERVLAKNKRWREAHKEKVAAYYAAKNKRWVKEHKEEHRAYMREYMRKYRKTGPVSKRGICTNCTYLKDSKRDSWCAYKRLASPWEDKSCECEFWEK